MAYKCGCHIFLVPYHTPRFPVHCFSIHGLSCVQAQYNIQFRKLSWSHLCHAMCCRQDMLWVQQRTSAKVDSFSNQRYLFRWSLTYQLFNEFYKLTFKNLSHSKGPGIFGSCIPANYSLLVMVHSGHFVRSRSTPPSVPSRVNQNRHRCSLNYSCCSGIDG